MSPTATARSTARSGTGRYAPARQPGRSPQRPRLQIVGAPQQLQQRKVAFTAAAVALGLGLLGLLLVTVSLGNGAYELQKLQGQSAQLAEQRNDLSEQLDDLSSPELLRARARELGMVDAPKTVVIRRSDGSVAGTVGAAQAAPVPPVASPDASPAQSAAPKTAAESVKPSPRQSVTTSVKSPSAPARSATAKAGATP